MALGVVRVKRKAYEEPAEALVIALKKSKRDEEQREVYLKLAATLPKEADFESGQIQAAISKDKFEKEHWRQSPKHIPCHSTVGKRIQYYKAERKEKRLQVLAGRRLIRAESQVQNVTETADSETTVTDDSENNLFVLYDIIEENEDPKSNLPEICTEQKEPKSSITCNGQPLQRVTNDSKSNDYVYDVYYIAKGNIDERFIQESLSIQPCDSSSELVSPDDEDEPDVYYEDEDDSNDEDNWRNDYPDEDSDFEKERDYYGNYECEEADFLMIKKLESFNIDEDEEGTAYAEYKARILSQDNSDGSDDDDEDENF